MIKNGFIRSVTGVWIRLAKFDYIRIEEEGEDLFCIYALDTNEQFVLSTHKTIKDAQNALDEMMGMDIRFKSEIEELCLPPRLHKTLVTLGCKTLEDARAVSKEDFISVRNAGIATWVELKRLLKTRKT
jgi:hypothetical protein